MIAGPERGPDVLGTRRWGLISRLHDTLTIRGDARILARGAVEALSQELGDGAVIVLLDPADEQTIVFESGHADTATRLAQAELVASLSEAEQRAWLASLNAVDARTEMFIATQFPEQPWAQKLMTYRKQVGLVDVAYAALRYRDGRTRGMLVCVRDAGALPYDEFDLSALASAADTISLGLDAADSEQRAAGAQREVARLAEQRRVLLAELVSAEQAERARIAADVHDDVMQLLAAAQLRMQLLLNQLTREDGDPRSAPTHHAADNVAALLSQAQTQLRRVLLDLEAPTGPERELHEALWQTAQSFFADTETAITVTGGLSEVPSEIASVFYRAGREAVSNARRHAQAAHVHVKLSEDPHSWSMEVIDDGVGIPLPIPRRPGHLGVRGMHNRIAAVGGTMTIGRNSNRGTCVKLWVPRHPALSDAVSGGQGSGAAPPATASRARPAG